jgi:hypothetical protein
MQGKVKEASIRNHFSQLPEIRSIKGDTREMGRLFVVPVAMAAT